MRDKIKVGEYIRTDDGIIGKVVAISEEGLITIDEWKIKVSFFEGFEYDNTLESSYIKKHSKNIIDLIEVGDYVNGEYILDVGEGYIVREGNEYKRSNIYEKEIERIVTHEQFESQQYII